MSDTAPTLNLPDGTPEYMRAAYYGCLQWAIGSDDVWARYCADNGIKNTPKRPASPLEAMIDKACGVITNPMDDLMAFKKWHDEFIWGDPLKEPEEANDDTM